MKKTLLLSMIAVALTACATNAPKQSAGNPAEMSMDRIVASMLEVSNSIDRNQRILAEAKNTQVMTQALEIAGKDKDKNNKLENLTTNKIPYGMEDRISIEWSGPIEEIVKTLTLKTGKYRFAGTEGKKPPTPILIRLSETDEMIGVLLRKVGVDARNTADVIVDEQQMLVKVKYNM